MMGFTTGISFPYSPPTTPIVVPEPAVAILPLTTGQRAICRVGQSVAKGELIAMGDGVSPPAHSPISGKVAEIGLKMTHLGVEQQAIVLSGDGQENTTTWGPVRSVLQDETAQELLEQIYGCAIPYEDGCSLATLLASVDTPISTLIICGIDQEPFLSSEDGILREEPETVLGGLRILQRILRPASTVVAVTAEQKEAIGRISCWVGRALRMSVMPKGYPMAAPSVLAQMVGVTRMGQSLFDAGVVVISATTAAKVSRAIYQGEAVTRELLTIRSGRMETLAWATLGTPLADILQSAGHTLDQVILGGPMTGKLVKDLSVPLVAGMSALTVVPQRTNRKPLNCIRCGACMAVCPEGLRPYTGKLDGCIGCGACTYVCPAGRKLGKGKKEAVSVG